METGHSKGRIHHGFGQDVEIKGGFDLTVSESFGRNSGISWL